MLKPQPAPAFEIDVSHQGNAEVVSLRGSLADDANRSAKEILLGLVEKVPNRLVIDLEELDYISSSGIGLLVSVFRRCRQRGIPMPICCLRSEILELFKLTRLSQVFEIFQTRAQALAGR